MDTHATEKTLEKTCTFQDTGRILEGAKEKSDEEGKKRDRTKNQESSWEENKRKEKVQGQYSKIRYVTAFIPHFPPLNSNSSPRLHYPFPLNPAHNSHNQRTNRLLFYSSLIEDSHFSEGSVDVHTTLENKNTGGLHCPQKGKSTSEHSKLVFSDYR